MRVMEVTLTNAFLSFKNDYPKVIINQRTFEQLRTKHIRLGCYAQQLQCCCTYHTNIDYIRKVFNNLFLKNGKDNNALLSTALCASNSVSCIMRISKFPHSSAANPALEKIRIAVTMQSKSISLSMLPTY